MKRPTLLCVDNDPRMCGFYEKALGSHGYNVVTAPSAPQALKVFQSTENHIDAVISDYQMPGMSGAQLAAELKQQEPALPVLMVSGCQPVVEEAGHFVDAAMLKGAPIDAIVEKVDRLLAASRRLRRDRHGARLIPLMASLALALVFLPKIVHNL